MSIRGEYEKLKSSRQIFVDRAVNSARVTVPHLFPEEGSEVGDKVTPWQSLGARGVNNLASKLLLSLFPPNEPFFRLSVDETRLAPAERQVFAEQKLDFEEALDEVSKMVLREVETTSLRPVIFSAIKQFIIAGNVLLSLPKDGGSRVFKLDSYVLERDPSGNVITIITKESLAPQLVPEEILKAMDMDEIVDKKDFDLYTRIERTKTNWVITQSIEDIEVEDSRMTEPLDSPSYIPVSGPLLAGENYGCSVVDDLIGDLVSLEKLQKAIIEGAEASARTVFAIRPASTVSIPELSRTKNLSYVSANPEDITAIQVNKGADLSVASQTVLRLAESLGYSFLLNSSVQRKGERVTAEEIRLVARELDTSQGGLFSIMSQELQLPMISALLARLSKRKGFPKIDDTIIKPQITTGVEAIGRGHDFDKLAQLMQILTPGELGLIRNRKVLRAKMLALGLDANTFLKSEEELQAEQQAAQAQLEAQQVQEIAKQATPNAVKNLTQEQ